MAQKTITVTNAVGLHARPASNFLKVANNYPCAVFLRKDGKQANAKSMLGILSLAIGKGSVIEIVTEGEKEDEALEALVAFVESLVE